MRFFSGGLLAALSLTASASAQPALSRARPSPAAALAPAAKRLRVLIDAGHGNPGNDGNRSLDCEREADVMLKLAVGLAEQLARDDGFDVRLTRSSEVGPSYLERLKAADSWADALVSLHSDARGIATAEWRNADCIGYRNDGAKGFAVLWSDEAQPALAARRGLLARTVAAALRHHGFTAYRGDDYPGLYGGDAENPGVFVDRHVPRQRIYLLRRPAVPSIIIETHHALDEHEVQQWREPQTLEALTRAVAQGLREALARPAAGH